MASRGLSAFDLLIGEFDKAIKVLAAPARAGRPLPAAPSESAAELPAPTAAISGRLMRVNHAGEVAAQALYRGQALTARSEHVRTALYRAADEELDHLSWCERRLGELKGRTSILNPVWYLGSFALGAAAGALGDKLSLGFIAETETQVEAHLGSHLERLPREDERSRSILEQMRHDEAAHGAQATSLGGEALPSAVRWVMKVTSRLMTSGSYWL